MGLPSRPRALRAGLVLSALATLLVASAPARASERTNGYETGWQLRLAGLALLSSSAVGGISSGGIVGTSHIPGFSEGSKDQFGAYLGYGMIVPAATGLFLTLVGQAKMNRHAGERVDVGVRALTRSGNRLTAAGAVLTGVGLVGIAVGGGLMGSGKASVEAMSTAIAGGMVAAPGIVLGAAGLARVQEGRARLTLGAAPAGSFGSGVALQF